MISASFHIIDRHVICCPQTGCTTEKSLMIESGRLTRVMFSGLEPADILNNKDRYAVISLPGTCVATQIKMKAAGSKDLSRIESFVMQYRVSQDDEWDLVKDKKTKVKVR